MQAFGLEFWTGGWKRLWYLRGVLAAVTLLGLLKSITGIGTETYLALFHTLFRDWNLFMGWLGGLIPFVPDIPPAVMNGLTFFLITVAPGYLEDVVADHRDAAEKPRWPVLSGAYHLFTGIALVVWGAFAVAALFSPTFLEDFLSPNPEAGMFVWSVVYLMLASWLLLPVVFFWVFCRDHPAYLRGLWSVALFLATLEALYWLKAPYVSDWMQTYVCTRGHAEIKNCASDA